MKRITKSLPYAFLSLSIIAAISIPTLHAAPSHSISAKKMQLLAHYDMKKRIVFNVTIGSFKIYQPKKIQKQLEQNILRMAHMNVDFISKKYSVMMASTTDVRSENALSFQYESINKNEVRYTNVTYDLDSYKATSVKEKTVGSNKKVSTEYGQISADTLDPLTTIFFRVADINFRVGAITKLKVSDGSQERENEVHFKVIAVEKIRAQGRRQKAYKVVMGSSQLAFITKEKGIKVTTWVAVKTKKVLQINLETPKTGLIQFLLKK